ncbi:protein lethal(2)essential for life-like [Bombus vancouverensis nearcticus]|uniref:protein lethal(2)essential for life-like n=1 Tax=Bombus vancouverensis nearcticus TaxID=2705178 RepID=UPI00402B9609
MLILPMLFSNWWGADVLVIRPRCRGFQRFQPYERDVDCKSSGISTVQADKNKFHVTLDVQQFVSEEVIVRVVGGNVAVEGKHEERQDEHGFISRQFVRKYLVLQQCNVNQLKSSLYSDEVLMINAPRKELNPQSKNERIIKVQIIG